MKKKTLLQDCWVWNNNVTSFVRSLIQGYSLNVCAGKNPMCDVNLDLDPKDKSILKGDMRLLSFDDNTFDYVIGSFILHHVQIRTAVREVYRVLADGGKAVFIENSANNKLLMLARNTMVGKYGIPKYGSQDESPLSSREIDRLRECFKNQLIVYYPSFVFLRLLAGYSGRISMQRGRDYCFAAFRNGVQHYRGFRGR